METTMTKKKQDVEYHIFKSDTQQMIEKVGKSKLLELLKQMLKIRNFEIRAESAYQHGHIGGFFHSYIGQEAIQTAAVNIIGQNNWWTTTYRCHALALLLGAPPNEVLSELYGKANGNAKGRGGSMHLYTDRMLGGFGIVGGHVPVATGAGFSIKYKGIKDQVSICFLGDGAVVQGAVHEAWNLASLWDLPCIFVIENNQWGMGTSVERSVCVPRLAEDKAAGYDMKSYTLDGMDIFNCLSGFEHIKNEVLETSRPVLVEAITERFKGHSISDPGLYRSKEELKQKMTRDPLTIIKNVLIEAGILTEEEYKEMDSDYREEMKKALNFADKSPWPKITSLEEDVFAP